MGLEHPAKGGAAASVPASGPRGCCQFPPGALGRWPAGGVADPAPRSGNCFPQSSGAVSEPGQRFVTRRPRRADPQVRGALGPAPRGGSVTVYVRIGVWVLSHEMFIRPTLAPLRRGYL